MADTAPSTFDPVRSEIYGVERLEQFAEALARLHRVDPRPRRRGAALLARFEDNARVLRQTYATLAEAARGDQAISPSAEWLIDNFHIIDDHLREIREALPAGYYRELPKLLDGELAGHPRVHAIAWNFVAHTDSRFDPELLERFVGSYQRITPLSMGELWAIPASLRLVLIENLRRIAEHIIRSREARARASELADLLVAAVDRSPMEVLLALRPYEEGPLDRSFAVELVQRLRDSDPAASPVIDWLESRIAEQETSADALVRDEHADQLAAHATVVNVITSMRHMSAFEWADFVEDVSVVESILRQDVTGSYSQADFATRDAYRHVIEELSRGTGIPEPRVAERVVARAGAVPADGGRERHLGWHLIDRGRRAFERELGYRRPTRDLLRRAFLGRPTLAYLGTIGILTGMLLFLLLSWAVVMGEGWFVVLLLGILALVPATDLAIAVVHRDVAELVPPRRLPKLELRDGVPPELRTLVVIPTLLSREDDARDYAETLERHYLASSEGHLAFALLTDWNDAPSETMPDDDRLLAAAAERLAGLNQRYGPAPWGGSRFLLLHRHRRWNAGEGKWMGWERKRGKIEELNRLLRGAVDTSYILRADGLTDLPPDVRYVLTLDADTRLAPGSARRLVGTIAHPLNRAVFDPALRRVVEGYGIIQPRITPMLPPTGERTLYHRIFSGPTGIDPYSAAVSDVYQDLFGEGIFVGKGIYEVDAFEAAMTGRAPENALLSHDLFEGTWARCGLATDIELFDEFPTHYETSARRVHRWARGDWQLLPWILGRPPAVNGRRAPSSMHVIARWKMVDNLRRSLSAPSTLLLLLIGWIVHPVSPLAWTGFVVATLAMPAAVPVVTAFLPRRREISKRSHVRGVVGDVAEAGARVGLAVVFLANRAILMTDAIARTLWRLAVSRRHLLEWVPAAAAGRAVRRGLMGAYRTMWRPVALAAAAAAALLALRPAALEMALPVLLLWVASPAIAHWLSHPITERPGEELSVEESGELRRIARLTWRFFETLVGGSTHDLPPDNVQEDPSVVVARRTSPTNIGMYLMSVLAARDFHWIGVQEMTERIERVFATLDRLERFHGHLFNWYDIERLVPLEPRYVSTVDSGNLAGHLLALAEGCREAAARLRAGEAASSAALAGIADAVAIAEATAEVGVPEQRPGAVARHDLEAAMARLRSGLADPPASPDGWRERLGELALASADLLDVAQVLVDEIGGSAYRELAAWATAIQASVASHTADLATREGTAARNLADRLVALAVRADRAAAEMDFAFLYDPSRKLFPIGYRVSEGRHDQGYYDLLASEARLASLIAIAKGDVSVEHWFRLGRATTPVGGGAALLSWSGSMFEYLMPYLIMDTAPGTLLDRSQSLVVNRQIRYGAERGVPWGISESAYNARDLELTYQYSHFGIPGLGLTRGLSEDLVVAPYATALAAMVRPRAALQNFRRLAEEGARGTLGYYEALDYTPERVPQDQEVAVVRAYMAHHEGMAIVSIANVLFDGVMRHRFHAVPTIGANDLLLQERVPRDVAVARPRAEEVRAVRHVRQIVPPVIRHFTSPHYRMPRTHILSNGRYSVMMTNAGAGYSRWNDLAVTRWREDTTRDAWGSFVFLRDVTSGAVWSAGFQPTIVLPDDYEVTFSEDRIGIHRRDEAIATAMDVIVSPEDDGELRRVTVKNLGARPRVIELTSYAEIVLTSPDADRAHPAFQNLFVQTELVSPYGALLATRRPRSGEETPVWAVHVAAVDGAAEAAVQCETDRARFLDRGRGIRTPSCVMEGRPLSNTTGAVLDPIFALRRTVRLRPGEAARVIFSTLVAETREQAIALADKYHDPATFEREAGLAWTQSQVLLQHLGISADEAHAFQRLAGRILYSDPGLRPSSSVLARSGQSQRALWRHGIGGDLPIVTVRIDQIRDRDIVRQVLRAHEYWGWKGLAVDLVVLNEHEYTYSDDLQEWLERILRVTQGRAGHAEHPRHGQVTILRADRMTPEELDLIRAAARMVILSHHGSLVEQLDIATRAETFVPAPPRAREEPGGQEGPPPPRPRLSFFNGLGGFAEGGREYVTILGEGQWTPAPWVNVIANPGFGFLVSEAGSGFTWAGNSRENRLTPWSNDPVSDPPGEVLYVRDEETGAFWTPTPLPIRETTAYVVRHGQGYTGFEHQSHDVALDLVQYVPADDPVKISRLVMRNLSGHARRLSVTAYVEWVLGTLREISSPHVWTEVDETTGALFARNSWSEEFGERVAFADLGGKQTQWTADRGEFLGRNGGPRGPAGMASRAPLSGAVGGGLDPCAALRATVTIPPHASVEIVFLLGQGADAGEAQALVEKYREADLDAVLSEVQTFWEDVLGALQVRTPDYSMAIMLNRWLLYQTLTCRVWARSAFYQSGGAYGFRDQLQDVMALTVTRREIAREHLLRAAGRQFAEGDVQHWWHSPSGRGVRTRISDDRLWLPFAITHYLDVTGDHAILDEEVPFLKGPALEAEEVERYFEPEGTTSPESLYEHCARAIDVSMGTGPHGLPLIGAGDWNDGMNRVGWKGSGESVWLGWFLHMTMARFTECAARRGDEARVERWRSFLTGLEESLERHGWDGDWYRRAWFDDGTPLGSAANPECRIDSIAQSWGVISGAAERVRGTQAMKAVEQYLVRRGDGLVLLFTPPFDHWEVDPGYIKGYLPGVRENGGQYTHAAIWSVLAFAELGDGDKATELFSVLNPINHASTRAGIHRYKVEPYVSVADVYAEAPHLGRGGWTWYTGSAGWMYRAGVEWILGFRLRGESLYLDPCIPRDWGEYEISFRYHSARYEVVVENPGGVMRGVERVEVDGRELADFGRRDTAAVGADPGHGNQGLEWKGARIPLQDDGREHRVRVVLG